MFCSQCGKEFGEDVRFCPVCGFEINGAQAQHTAPKNEPTKPRTHTVPKCNCCGKVGDWKVAPLFRGVDYVLGIALLIFGIVPGIIYFGVVGLIRSNKDNRSKICRKCGAKNMFTYIY